MVEFIGLLFGTVIFLFLIFRAFSFFASESEQKDASSGEVIKPNNPLDGLGLLRQLKSNVRPERNLHTAQAPLSRRNDGKYLESLRANSCYPVVREVHGVVVFLAVIGNVLFLFAGLLAASNTGYGIFGQHSALVWGIAAAMAFGIFIERALFVAILDAVDVMVDNARYQRQRDQQPPKAD